MKKIVVILIALCLNSHVIADKLDPLSLNKKACSIGKSTACMSVALDYYKGKGVKKSISKSLVFFEKACDLKHVNGCMNAGIFNQKGKGTKPNILKAIKYYDIACHKQLGDACQNLGMIYAQGLHNKRKSDNHKAALFFKKACDYGDPKGCHALGIFYDSGKGVVKNAKQAVKYYQKACIKDDYRACSNLAVMYYQGTGVKKHAGKSATLFKKGCDGGYKKGCKQLKSLQQLNVSIKPVISCHGVPVTIDASDGNDVINGTMGDDVINGLAGDDIIKGLGGDDLICGGDGNDVISGGDGNDILFGGAGDDHMNGAKGKDSVDGGDGNDVIYGGAGNDNLQGGAGNDEMHGGSDGGEKMIDMAIKSMKKTKSPTLKNSLNPKKQPSQKTELISPIALESQCEAKDYKACYTLGSAYLSGDGVPLDFDKAYYFLGMSCLEDKNSDACVSVGVLYEQGKGVKKDIDTAKTSYEAACLLHDNLSGCHNLATLLTSNEALKDIPRAAKLFEKNCKKGFPQSCHSIGAFYLNGKNPIKKNKKKAIEYFTLGCKIDDAISCFNIATVLEALPNLKDRFSKATALYQRSCNLGLSQACYNLGNAYHSGKGVKQDYTKARELYKQACDSNMAQGCYNLGGIYEYARDTKKDMTKAIAAYTKSCKLDFATACSKLGLIYETGDGIPKNKEKAKSLYQKACKGGFKPACKHLKKIENRTENLTKNINVTTDKKITRVETQDNLKATNKLVCSDINALKPSYTPADLFNGVLDCITQDNYGNAAQFYLRAKMYGRYDTMRVADSSAHQAISVLKLKIANSINKQQQELFDKAFKRLAANQDNYCKKIVPKPNYYPRYMIQHGIKAIIGTKTGLVKDFDEDEAWRKVYSDYLRCPTD